MPILELLNDLMFKHRASLKEMGNESLVGITDLVSGEKDPRNLMIIFSILKVVMVEWDVSGHAEVRSHPLTYPPKFNVLDDVRFYLLLLSHYLPAATR